MSLGRAVDQAAAALTEATRDRTVNEFAAVRLPDQFDPRTLLRDPAAAGVVGSYERPDQDFALVGIGEASRIDLAIGDTPTAARAQVQTLFQGVRPGTRSAIRPRLIGGFRFAPEQTPGSPWERFGAGALVLPRMLFVREEGEVGVVLAPGTRASEAIDLLERCDRSGRADTAHEVGGPLRSARSIDEDEWRDNVRAMAIGIREGEYEKAVLATSIELVQDRDLSLGATLSQLRSDYSHCHVVSFTAGDSTLVCASPELLINLEGGHARTLGLAASQRRGSNPAEDRALGLALMADSKSREEHAVVVREIVERLETATDALEVDAEPAVRRFRNIQHLATRIEGETRDGVDILELVERLHPTPAVCGRPREVARRVIAEHEGFDRGWYAGPVGWLDANGDGEFAVALRTALIRGPRAWLFAGNGIMGDSDPEAELEEVTLKMRPLADALGDRVPNETSAIPA